MVEVEEIRVPGFEKVIKGIDEETGLRSFIAIHDTTLGPALGGLRIYPYNGEKEAFDDVLKLAKAMTYKSAIAENGLGGGKSVIIGDPKAIKSEQLFFAFAEVLDKLEGQYIVAEDVGTTCEDMKIIFSKTPYVAALPFEKSSGDPSRFTAWGVYQGMRAAAQFLWGSPSLKNRRIAIQGLGNVGGKLADFLFWEGADLYFSEIDQKKLKTKAALLEGKILEGPFCAFECEILAPCALGGVITQESISQLKCSAIAGGANNQLENEQLAKELKRKKILYAPDYVINAGGIINAAEEFNTNGYSPIQARNKTDEIYETLLTIFVEARQRNKTPNQIAKELAEYKIGKRIGARKHPIKFK